MTAHPPSDWLEQGNNAALFFSVALMGFFVWIFGRPIPRAQYAKAAKPRKAKRTARKTRTVQKGQKVSKAKKAKVAPPKKWATLPNYTPQEIAHIEWMKSQSGTTAKPKQRDDW